MQDPDALRTLLAEHGATFTRNVSLVRFVDFTADELAAVRSSAPTCDWDAVRSTFADMQFASLLKDSYWSKFHATFDRLWAT